MTSSRGTGILPVMSSLTYHLSGLWRPGQVHLRWSPSSYNSTPELDALIEAEWQKVKARLGDRIFDGPMCRMESYDVDEDGRLHIALSQTSYRIFVGTNMAHPEWADSPGRQVMANTVGVSTALITADGFFMLGRRSDSVAYYPRMLHPFSGSLEPRERLDLFDEALRELNEELGLTPADITDIACLGIVEDMKLRHLETILYARTKRSRGEIEQSLLGDEHTASWSCQANPPELTAALADRSSFTPVAQAAVELYALCIKCASDYPRHLVRIPQVTRSLHGNLSPRTRRSPRPHR